MQFGIEIKVNRQVINPAFKMGEKLRQRETKRDEEQRGEGETDSVRKKEG